MTAAERREAVLDAALAVITRTGIFQVKMGDVADQAGVTKPIVYDYFANADELLTALLQREGQRAFEIIGRVLPDPESLPRRGDRVEILVEKVGLFLLAVRERPNLWRLTLMPPDGTSPALRARVEAAREEVRLRIAKLVSWCVRDAKRFDVEMASHVIHALAQRFARQMILQPEEYTPERIVRFTRQVLKLAER
jgi:AcrR family transcriptional regulator